VAVDHSQKSFAVIPQIRLARFGAQHLVTLGLSLIAARLPDSTVDWSFGNVLAGNHHELVRAF
jgi:hypothetical protein